MKTSHLIIFLWVSIASTAFAQTADTVSVMTYNLLQFGTNGINCTPRSTKDKINYIKTITSHYKPDIFCANEISAQEIFVTNIRDYALNSNGVGDYKSGAFSNQANSNDIVVGLFYNYKRFTLIGQKVANTSVRDIVFYKLLHNASISNSDSVFITVGVAHLKAGTNSSDASSRAAMTSNAMTFLNANSTWAGPNILFCGDFNLYTSTEQAYQNLTNSSSGINFNDPVNKPGSWSANSDFALYHTQSPRTTNQGDCGSTGGMDDRFDFVLMSNAIKNANNKISYVSNSYQTCGQDGKRFDSDLYTPSNSTAPSSVISALFLNSDHLPVMAKFSIAYPTTDLAEDQPLLEKFNISFTPNEIILPKSYAEVIMLDIRGNVIHKSENSNTINTNNCISGIYIVKVKNNSESIIKKITIVRD